MGQQGVSYPVLVMHKMKAVSQKTLASLAMLENLLHNRRSIVAVAIFLTLSSGKAECCCCCRLIGFCSRLDGHR